ncbi:MAG: hypothetical protein AAGM84_18070 [Pseudomonadota bacterium]
MTTEAVLSTIVSIMFACLGVYAAARFAERRGLSERAADAMLCAGFLVPAAGSIALFIYLSAIEQNPLPLIYQRILEFIS